jgi:hypothetical protein
MLKRPISGTQNAEAPKKRKILPVFLGALGGTLTQQQRLIFVIYIGLLP